jgi:histidinol phosphatase-like PHP family hydrolase
MLTSDWHIHTRNSCDDASLKIDDLIQEAAALEIRDFGITDHIHTPFNLPDLVRSRTEFLANHPGPRFHFGVEVSCVSQWELAQVGNLPNPVYGLRTGGPANGPLAIGLTETDLQKYEIEYVVGGTHWPMYVPFEREVILRDYHRQNLFLASHPMVTIVAHPWWWMGHWQDPDGKYRSLPWFDDFNKIPKSVHAEFAATVLENNKIVEINLSAILLNPQYPERFKQQYLEYLADLKSRGCQLALGSDCHFPHYSQIDFAAAEQMLNSVGIDNRDCWRLPPQEGR